jgi:hypothetical protein
MSSCRLLAPLIRPPSPAVAAHDGHATLAGRAVLRRAHRLPVAAPAAASGLPALAHGVRLLPRFLAAGVWESMRHHLVVMLREGEGRRPAPRRPSSTPRASRRRKGGTARLGRGEAAEGRKRHVAVDTQGLLLGVVVHAADIQDADGLWAC